ncbi:hypothetical protein RLOC_00012502 [Lonchura striata]|uniref:Uncharacterized protein n=1 Tax=Lonchura striata TaxID=40157 RepID=A0A218V903_9PASE|nr:hypothetical protein RLOC_00012502 [Lonchura striata domestica]
MVSWGKICPLPWSLNKWLKKYIFKGSKHWLTK